LAIENRSTILLTSFLPLLVKAASLARPEFQVEAAAGDRDVVLSEASAERGPREVARQPLSVLPGTRIVTSAGIEAAPLG
jgi:hypothetical protein